MLFLARSASLRVAAFTNFVLCWETCNASKRFAQKFLSFFEWCSDQAFTRRRPVILLAKVAVRCRRLAVWLIWSRTGGCCKRWSVIIGLWCLYRLLCFWRRCLRRRRSCRRSSVRWSCVWSSWLFCGVFGLFCCERSTWFAFSSRGYLRFGALRRFGIVPTLRRIPRLEKIYCLRGDGLLKNLLLV